MSQQSLSDFIKRCQDTMAEYSRLRSIGVAHDFALMQSGFREAVMGRPVNQAQQMRDVRRIIAGDEEC